MADEIVLCRRKDDHSQTHPIALSALRYFPDWEPIPEEGQEPGPAEAAPPEAAEPEPTPKTARKSTEVKGRGE